MKRTLMLDLLGRRIKGFLNPAAINKYEFMLRRILGDLTDTEYDDAVKAYERLGFLLNDVTNRRA